MPASTPRFGDISVHDPSQMDNLRKLTDARIEARGVRLGNPRGTRIFKAVISPPPSKP
jgi:hypothetical protein